MSLLERVLDRCFNRKTIVNCDRDPYLLRWFVIRTKPFGLFVHKFIRSDEDRALHCHPWNFIVIPIWRGYIEYYASPRPSGEVYEGRRRVLPILGTRFRRGTYRHRVELLPKPELQGVTKWLKPVVNDGSLSFEERPISERADIFPGKPAWSIFIRFKKFRDWGFHTPEGWIQWNKWWQDKCE